MGTVPVEDESCSNCHAVDQRDKKSSAPGVVRNPYSVVLIDGDGLSIPDKELAAGYEGGERVADSLYKVLQQYKRPDDAQLHIWMFGSMWGKAHYHKIDIVKVREFSHGFTHHRLNECPSYFVDAGIRQEAADEKVKERFHVERRNENCTRLMLLGIAHDGGYKTLLEEESVRNDDRVLMLIEEGGKPVQRDINRLICEGAIRGDYVTLWPKTAKLEVGRPETEHHAGASIDKNEEHPSQPTATFTPMADVNFSRVHLKSLKKRKAFRKLSPRPCYDHYLAEGGAGCENSACKFGHNYELDEAEIDCLRDEMKAHMLQLLPLACWNFYLNPGKECSARCTYGHHHTLGPAQLAFLRNEAASFPCRWGFNCTREGCLYQHPRGAHSSSWRNFRQDS